MDPIGQQIKKVSNELKDYVETRFELLVLNISDKVTMWIGEAIQQLVGFAVLGLGLLFAMIALGFYVSELVSNQALGFAIVSAPVLLIGLIMVLIKPKGIARGIQSQFMAEVLDALDDKKEEVKTPLLKSAESDKEGDHVEK